MDKIKRINILENNNTLITTRMLFELEVPIPAKSMFEILHLIETQRHMDHLKLIILSIY